MSTVAYTALTNDGRPDNDTLSTSVDIADAQQVFRFTQRSFVLVMMLI